MPSKYFLDPLHPLWPYYMALFYPFMALLYLPLWPYFIPSSVLFPY